MGLMWAAPTVFVVALLACAWIDYPLVKRYWVNLSPDTRDHYAVRTIRPLYIATTVGRVFMLLLISSAVHVAFTQYTQDVYFYAGRMLMTTGVFMVLLLTCGVNLVAFKHMVRVPGFGTFTKRHKKYLTEGLIFTGYMTALMVVVSFIYLANIGQCKMFDLSNLYVIMGLNVVMIFVLIFIDRFFTRQLDDLHLFFPDSVHVERLQSFYAIGLYARAFLFGVFSLLGYVLGQQTFDIDIELYFAFLVSTAIYFSFLFCHLCRNEMAIHEWVGYNGKARSVLWVLTSFSAIASAASFVMLVKM